MSYLFHPHVTNQLLVVTNNLTVLTADTTVVLDCCATGYSKYARDQLEREQMRVADSHGFDEVCLTQVWI